MIKAVGFDYGGVIGGVGSAGGNFTQRMCDIIGMDREAYLDAYFSMNSLINMGEVEGWHEFWKLFLDKVGKSEKYDEVVVLSDMATNQLDVVDQRMIQLIDSLREQGYKTGLLSNATIDQGKRMRAAGLDSHFDVFLISSEIKIMKPDPRVFKELCKKLQILPAELVFVDDAEKSLSTANVVGFVPVHYKSFDELHEQLALIGVVNN